MALTWAVMAVAASWGFACMENSSCSPFDFFLSSVLGLGFLAPAYLAAFILGIVFPKLELHNESR